jgi:isopenicillin-N epimerase
MTFGAALRPEWWLDPDVDFLNNGSFGACPKVVLEAQDAWRRRLETQPVRFMMAEAPPKIREVASALGVFVGARGEDLVWVDNATSGVNAVVGSWRLGPGDAVLTTTHVYGAVDRTLQYHASRGGFRLDHADVPFPLGGADAVVAAFEAAITPETRWAVVDHVTSATGLVWPVERLVAACRSRGIRVLVDGAHAPGMLALDLGALGADAYTGNAHKWLFAPKGCAFLWASPELQDELHPPVISHGLGAGFDVEFDWTGTKDPSPWLAVPDAIAFAERLGLEAMRHYQRALCSDAVALLADAWDVDPPAPDALRAALGALPFPGERPATAAEAGRLHDRLRDVHKIEVPVYPFRGRIWIRVSAQVYNTLDQYERLAEAVRGL